MGCRIARQIRFRLHDRPAAEPAWRITDQPMSEQGGSDDLGGRFEKRLSKRSPHIRQIHKALFEPGLIVLTF